MARTQLDNMIRKTTLSNGARIITEVVDEVYSASIGIWVDVGSEDEGQENNGVSHCLEHMLFKGTSRRTAQEIAQEIEDVGGGLGAATSKENTCFYGRVMGDQLHVAIAPILLGRGIRLWDDLRGFEDVYSVTTEGAPSGITPLTFSR